MLSYGYNKFMQWLGYRKVTFIVGFRVWSVWSYRPDLSKGSYVLKDMHPLRKNLSETT